MTLPPDFAALQDASRAGDLARVRELLDRGTDPNTDPGMPHGFSPLMLAAWKGHADVVALLIERGADVHRADGDGFTAITLAAKGRSWTIVELLAAAGADPTHADASGVSALGAAERARKPRLVALLRQSAARQN
jgi:ankyrin repeat protein